MYHLVTFSDPNKRGPQTAAVLVRTAHWAAERFLIANSDVTILKVTRAPAALSKAEG